MSYILEALKKSSDERARLATDAAPPAPSRPDAAPAVRRSARWPVAVIGVGALAAVAWVGVGALGHDDAPAAAQPDAAEAAAAVAVVAAVAPEPAPIDAAPAKAKARPAPERAVENRPSVTPVDVAPPPKAPAKPAPAANVAAAPSASDARAEMPPELLRQVLAIPISAHIYSSQPGERMVIIDGRAVREGDVLPTGMQIEQITPKGIAVSYQGYRAKRSVQ